VNPQIGRIAFNMGIILLILSLIPLPLLRPHSASFIIDLMTIIVISVFIIVITYEVKREVKRELQEV